MDAKQNFSLCFQANIWNVDGVDRKWIIFWWFCTIKVPKEATSKVALAACQITWLPKTLTSVQLHLIIINYVRPIYLTLLFILVHNTAGVIGIIVKVIYLTTEYGLEMGLIWIPVFPFLKSKHWQSLLKFEDWIVIASSFTHFHFLQIQP